MSEEPKTKSNLTNILVAVVLVPIFYVLSVGPATMIDRRVGRLPKWIGTFYAPLEWLYDHQPIIRKPLDGYCDLWRGR
jgi:hypothetical protein